MVALARSYHCNEKREQGLFKAMPEAEKPVGWASSGQANSQWVAKGLQVTAGWPRTAWTSCWGKEKRHKPVLPEPRGQALLLPSIFTWGVSLTSLCPCSMPTSPHPSSSPGLKYPCGLGESCNTEHLHFTFIIWEQLKGKQLFYNGNV